MAAPNILVSIVSLLAAAQTAPPGIVIDGQFDDWSRVTPALDDPADAPAAAVDFGQVRVSHDGEFVHVFVEVGRTVNAQRLDGRIELLLDLDTDTSTGREIHGMRGVDVIVELSPPDPRFPERAGRGAGIALPIDQPPPGDRMRLTGHIVGLTFAPSYASDRFELRMQRGAALPMVSSFLGAGRFRGRFVFVDRAGEIGDTTEDFSHNLSPIERVRVAQPTDPLTRAQGTDLRIVTWNIEKDSLRDHPDSIGLVLRALRPDVILFQELTDRDDPQALAALLDAALPPSPSSKNWTVLRGAGGGSLRCAVASQLELTPYAPLDPLPLPDRPDRSVRVLGAEVTHEGRRLLAVSVHLRCCGRAGSFEDRTRLVEADAIRRAVDRAVAARRFDGVVVGGDLNLVGSRWPLDVLTENLVVVEALQLDGRSNATWSDVRQPFMPGRLDFLLLSEQSLAARRAFVLDARDLAQRWLRIHGLDAGDIADTSDHMPLVADLRWRPGR